MSIGKFATTRVFSASSPSSSFDGGAHDEVANQIGSASEDEDDVGEFVVDTDYCSSGLPERWDVLGLGQAMVNN